MKKVHWLPSNLNVIIGPNGAGKSNLLRFLELMSIAAQARLGKYIQSLGGMEPIVWDGQATRLVCQLKMLPADDENRAGLQEALIYQLEMARLGQSSAYRIEQENLAYDAQSQIKQPLLKRAKLNGWIQDKTGQSLKIEEEIVSEEESLLSIASDPLIADAFIYQFKRQLASWTIYHDIHVDRAAPIRQAVVTRSERRVEPDGQNLIAVLHTLYTENREFRYDLNAAMRSAFGNEFEELLFPPAADQRTQLRVIWKSLKRGQSAAELSDGMLRFLLLLTILASPSPAPLIAIDEPEMGLHPAMLPIVAEYAVGAADKTQVILTTHSPQLLNAFTDTRPTITVAMCDQGETHLNNLTDEALDYWLKEYALGTLFTSGELEDLV
ncbi:MAG TPA: chromosome segregation protein SMC [Thiotrichaceae bacterium]|nr:chromosome segregation protein SMC [Thiotrichaceae bacterium]